MIIGFFRLSFNVVIRYQPPKSKSQFVSIAPLLQLLKSDCDAVLSQFASIDYEKSTTQNDVDMQPLMSALRKVYASHSACDSGFSSELTQVSA
jgi:hypothetical protein